MFWGIFWVFRGVFLCDFFVIFCVLGCLGVFWGVFWGVFECFWMSHFQKKMPFFKRARLTGLSAERARRTKSRGPKGLQLEVGAA